MDGRGAAERSPAAALSAPAVPLPAVLATAATTTGLPGRTAAVEPAPPGPAAAGPAAASPPRAPRRPRLARLRPRGQSLVVAVATAVLLVYAAWRITLGAKLNDDGHVVALALRLSQGDQPFVDEMNVQALGSLWAVPFTWLWTHTVGLTGLVLASRAFFVLVALAVGWLAYRALRPAFGPVVSAAAVAVPLLAPPYDILSISYNTSPLLGSVLAVCAGHAAVRRPAARSRRRWAAVSGAALAGAVISNPLLLPGALVVAVAVVLAARRRDVVGPFVLTLVAFAVPILVWLAFVVTPDIVRATLDYTADYRGRERIPGQKLSEQVQDYRTYLGDVRFVPLAVLALAASVPRLPRRLRAVVLLLLPVAAVVPSLQQVATGGRLPPVGALPGVLVLVLALALVVPVVARAVAERDRALGLLLALSLPAALVSVPVFAAMTLSGTTWGVAAIGAAPAVTALVVGWASTVGRAWPRVARAASGLLVVAVAVLLTLTPFRDPFPWALDTRISSGAFAGTRTTAESAVYIDAVRESAARWTRPGDAVLFYGVPAGPLLVDAPVASNILWLADFGPAGQVTVDWFTRTGRTPAVAFLDAGLVVREGGLPKLAERDPLVAHLLDRYRIVEAGRAFAGPVVLVRR